MVTTDTAQNITGIKTFNSTPTFNNNLYIGTTVYGAIGINKGGKDILYPNKAGTLATTDDIPSVEGLASEQYVINKIAEAGVSKQDKLDSWSNRASVADNKLTINYKVRQEDNTYVDVPVEFEYETPTNMVTTDTNQTITGNKTFRNLTIIDGFGAVYPTGRSINNHKVITIQDFLLPEKKSIAISPRTLYLNDEDDNEYNIDIPEEDGTFALTSDIPDISGLATKEELEPLATKEYVDSKIQKPVTIRINGTLPATIGTFASNISGGYGSFSAIPTDNGTICDLVVRIQCSSLTANQELIKLNATYKTVYGQGYTAYVGTAATLASTSTITPIMSDNAGSITYRGAAVTGTRYIHLSMH